MANVPHRELKNPPRPHQTLVFVLCAVMTTKPPSGPLTYTRGTSRSKTRARKQKLNTNLASDSQDFFWSTTHNVPTNDPKPWRRLLLGRLSKLSVRLAGRECLRGASFLRTGQFWRCFEHGGATNARYRVDRGEICRDRRDSQRVNSLSLQQYSAASQRCVFAAARR